MERTDKKRKLLYLLFFALIAYLVINTGIVSDDILYTSNWRNTEIAELVVPFGGWMTTPVEVYTHAIWYHFFRFDNSVLINIIKISYIIVCFYFITKFFGIYLTTLNAFLVSFFFLFFPSHDATIYWFLGQYFTLCIAFYLYSYYLAHNNRFLPAILTAIIASFVCYGSPIVAFSLFVIFIINREVKKAFVLLIPNLFYCVYYLFVTRVMHSGINRIPANIDIPAITKQFILQIVAFTDSTIGPSMWLKLYYSFGCLSIASVIMGVIGIAFLYRTYKKENEKYDYRIITGFIILAISSFLIFSIMPGYYPQLAFNLGNRTTMFGSLLIVYLIVLVPLPKKAKIVFFSILLFSILGISDHWKGWYLNQQRVIANVINNKQFEDIKGEVVYVSGNQYSRFGRINHIEFFSEQSVVGPLFKFLLKRDCPTKPLNKRHKYENGYLIDTKYGERLRIDNYINVYDSENDRLLKIKCEDINRYIDGLPDDNRHWIQIIGNEKIKKMILDIMPRLKYAL